MRIDASAPGKLVLTGEYAVLEGAPALVMAVDRRARVTLDDGADDTYSFDAPDLGIRMARCHLTTTGHVQWIDVEGADSARLGVVAAVLETMAAGAMPVPFHAHLDTRSFFVADDASAKLGLGSSAALAVALAGAIGAREGLATPSMDKLIEAHRRVQGGRGSGLDIAASLTGGIIVYQWHDGRPRAAPAAWPTALLSCCVWSGRSASTDAALRRLAAWRETAPACYASLMDDLGLRAASATAAAVSGDAGALLETMAAYAAGLAQLGAVSGIDIVCAEHRAIAAIAADCEVVYKTCGAGGGDIGMAFSIDIGRLQDFRRRIARAGFRVLDVQPDAQGLRVPSQLSCNRRTSWTTYA